ncbi:WxL domain-containing protein [Vagococcus sp. JNUCC 83]
MKKFLAINAGFVLACVGLAPTSLAANTTTADGTVGFTKSSSIDNDFTIPEVAPIVEITPPSNGGFVDTGEGYGLIVPPLDFGIHEIKLVDESYSVKAVEYTAKSDTNKKYYLPPMVAVKDQRGLSDGKWSVGVKIDGDFATDTSTVSNPQILQGANIKINSGLLFNNTKLVSGGVIDLTDQDVTADSNFSLKAPMTINSSETTLMSSSNGKGAGQTTFVPDTRDNYNKVTAAKGDFYDQNATFSAIQLNVPGTSNRLADKTYTATLTWNISTTP